MTPLGPVCGIQHRPGCSAREGGLRASCPLVTCIASGRCSSRSTPRVLTDEGEPLGVLLDGQLGVGGPAVAGVVPDVQADRSGSGLSCLEERGERAGVPWRAPRVGVAGIDEDSWVRSFGDAVVGRHREHPAHVRLVVDVRQLSGLWRCESTSLGSHRRGRGCAPAARPLATGWSLGQRDPREQTAVRCPPSRQGCRD